jgi:hypothetical protein
MPKFQLKITSFEASRWFKNGDHPLDYSKTHDGMENGEPRQFTGEERRAKGWEGDVVRYFRHPDVKGSQVCDLCGKTMHEHGWIDQESPETVCPGDWVITVPDAGYLPLCDEDFAARFEEIQ